MTRLKECRLRSGLTLQEVANMAGVSNASISHYEMGRRLPDVQMLKRLSEIYNVSIPYIMGVDDGATPENQTQSKEKSELEKINMEAYEIVKDLPDEQLAIVRAFVAGLKAQKK